MEYDNKDKKMDVTDDANMETLQGVLKSEMDDAKDFIDQIDEERADATDYYLGNSPSSTSSMQSEFVSTDVRDSVLFMLPSIMRTFFGTSKVVEFIPKGPEDIAVAKQQTDYINYIIQQKNPGFKVMYDVFKDALVRKAGYVKAYWDDTISSSTHEYSNISPEAYQALMLDPDVEMVEEKVEMQSMTVMDQMTGEEIVQETPASYDVTIRRVKAKDQVCIEAVPTEEILISRHARDLHSSPYVAHRMVKTVSDLVAMGYDKEEMQQFAGSGSAVDEDSYELEQARNPYADFTGVDRADNNSKNVLM